MVDENVLEKVYQERLEERVIAHLAQVKSCSLEKAMDLDYHSKLSDKINRGKDGIQYLDYKVLVQILVDTEC